MLFSITKENSLYMSEFKSYLKDYRLKAGLTQEELAEIVKVRRETIIRLEAGKYKIGRAHV